MIGWTEIVHQKLAGLPQDERHTMWTVSPTLGRLIASQPFAIDTMKTSHLLGHGDGDLGEQDVHEGRAQQAQPQIRLCKIIERDRDHRILISVHPCILGGIPR